MWVVHLLKSSRKQLTCEKNGLNTIKKQNKTLRHGSFNNDQAFRPDFHDIVFRFLLLLRMSVFGSNGTLTA